MQETIREGYKKRLKKYRPIILRKPVDLGSLVFEWNASLSEFVWYRMTSNLRTTLSWHLDWISQIKFESDSDFQAQIVDSRVREAGSGRGMKEQGKECVVPKGRGWSDWGWWENEKMS